MVAGVFLDDAIDLVHWLVIMLHLPGIRRPLRAKQSTRLAQLVEVKAKAGPDNAMKYADCYHYASANPALKRL